MSEQYVYDVGEDNFESRVTQASAAVPVLVDFWAAWCGPCRALGPVLEGLASEYEGKFLLAKVDTDAHPALAQRFGVRGLPTVKVFRHGEPVDEFVGALPEPQVRPFIERHLAGPHDELLEEAARLATGDPDQAIELLRRAVDYEADAGRLWLALADLYATAGRSDEATDALGHLPANLRTGDRARAVEARIALARATQRDTDAADPHSVRLRDAARALHGGEHERGLELLGEILEDDPAWRDGAAREAMLAAFALPDLDAALAARWRRRIASLLN